MELCRSPNQIFRTGEENMATSYNPQNFRRMFLQLFHDAPVSGHLGRDRTLERVRQTAH